MRKPTENQSLADLAHELWDIRVKKATLKSREEDIAQRVRDELAEDRSARFGNIRIKLRGGGPTKRFKRELVRPHVTPELWASFFELKPSKPAVHITQNGSLPGQCLDDAEVEGK